MEKNKLKIIAFGGSVEIGKSMFALEYENEIIIIDAGLKFPDEEMLGIDLVLPDFTYLKQNKEKVKGIFLSHGHEDHIGALPYLLKEINAPVYGTKLTLAMTEDKLDEIGILSQVEQIEISSEKTITLNKFQLEFVPVCHSVPDGVAISIKTPLGTIFYSGDFKFDQTPIDGVMTDIGKLSRIGNEGVLLLLSDSTNAEDPGFTESEKIVGDKLRQIFKEAPGRVIVACFASHIHRIQQVFEAAQKTERKVVVLGRNMENNIAIARRLGYLKFDAKLRVGLNKINNYRPEKMIVLATGSQGEPMSALTRMATRNHPLVEVSKGDTVVVSAAPIPGNELAISRIVNDLYRCGAYVYYEVHPQVHVSGHGAQEELKLMLNIIKPRYFIPIHGEYRHLIHHIEIAKSVGISPENIFIMENGDIIEITNNLARKGKKIPCGMMFVDGLEVGAIEGIVLRDRQRLAEDGFVVVMVALDTNIGEIISGPDISSKGLVLTLETKEIMDEASELVTKIINNFLSRNISDFSVLKYDIHDDLGRYLFEKIGKRPMILPLIAEI